VAVVLNQVPLDDVVDHLGGNRNAVYRAVFDARRKIRAFLAANGLRGGRKAGTVMSSWAMLERFLRTDPADVGCEQAMKILHVYVDMAAADTDAADRYPGVAAHLAACDPCCADFQGLLAVVTEDC
jgi:hypothetical protein